MNFNMVNIENALFNYSNFEMVSKHLNKKKDVDKITKTVDEVFKVLQKIYKLQIKDINRIEIGQSEITYYTEQKQIKISCKLNKNLSKKIGKLPQGLLQFNRDKVGEKIVDISKKEDFANLYLYSSGGGGHKSAKDAQMERDFKKLLDLVKVDLGENGVLNLDVEMNPYELEKVKSLLNDERIKNPAKFSEWCKRMGLVKEIDVLHDYLGLTGVWASKQWDKAQQAGNVKKQESLASKQWLSDVFFGPVVFISTLRSLIRLNPKKVDSTQAMATPSILLAIKMYNKYFKPKGTPNIKLHLYMTDMPTKYAKHFFSSLDRISHKGGKEFLVLHAPKLEKGQSWEKLCNLPKAQIKELDMQDLPVRLDFIKAVNDFQPNNNNPNVELKVSHPQELKLLHKALKHQGGQISHLGNHDVQGVQYLNYPIDPKDKATFIMLGSQPTKSAIQEYVQDYLKAAKNNPQEKYQVFAFAGKFEKDGKCFYKELVEYIENQPNWPTNLRIIPLSYQNPKQLVSLAMNCDTITRSGGSTAMELLVLDEIWAKYPDFPVKRRFVHAQEVEGRTLENSIPLWEKGNYLYLKKKIKAKVINPKTLLSYLIHQ